jgi:hypothetical protein
MVMALALPMLRPRPEAVLRLQVAMLRRLLRRLAVSCLVAMLSHRLWRLMLGNLTVVGCLVAMLRCLLRVVVLLMALVDLTRVRQLRHFRRSVKQVRRKRRYRLHSPMSPCSHSLR